MSIRSMPVITSTMPWRPYERINVHAASFPASCWKLVSTGALTYKAKIRGISADSISIGREKGGRRRARNKIGILSKFSTARRVLMSFFFFSNNACGRLKKKKLKQWKRVERKKDDRPSDFLQRSSSYIESN